MKPLEKAYQLGSEAYQQGLSIDSYPYEDKRNSSNRITWSRAFQRAWLDGYQETQLKEQK